MGSFLLRLRTWWETADRTQRVVTIFGGAFLAILLLGTFYFASKPKMELAFSGLTYSEIAAVKDEIDKRGIPAEYGQNGTVLLPKDKILEVKAALAQANKLPMNNTSSSSELEKVSITTTPTVEQARLKLMLENDVAASIQFIDGVQSARVKITPGDTSPLLNESLPATASVAIVEKNGSGLTREQARAIARLVAYSVPGLDVKHVTIVNQAGVQLYDGQSSESAGTSAENKIAAEVNESKRRERELQSMLDAVFGPNSTVAKVNLTLNFDQKSTKTVTPIVGEAVSVMDYQEKMQGDRPSSGTAIGAPATGPGGDAATRRYDGLKKVTEFAKGENVESTESALGTVTGMKITVAVNKEKQLDVDKITEMATNFLPKSPAEDPNFSAVVTEVPFDTTAAKEAQKAASASAMTSKIQQALAILPIVALVVVGLMVVKAIAKAAKDQNVLVQALPDGRMMPIGVGALGAGASTSTEIVSAEAEENASPAVHKPKPKVDVGEIQEKVDITFEQIKKMTAEKPEAVALLIKSWLLETKR